jgi:serine/threonine protein kinase
VSSSLQNDTAALAGFHAEVRNARQVSHPNVCRVYDIGEVNGQHFLTMEYIDGEDLSSLLRRIGRLRPDKALETAHQICAGLAAAHDCGLLHCLVAGAACVQVDFTEGRLSLKLDPSGGLLKSFVALNNRVLDRFNSAERHKIGVHIKNLVEPTIGLEPMTCRLRIQSLNSS